MRAFSAGIGIIFGASAVFYIVKYLIDNLIIGTVYGIVLVTGTNSGTVIMQYLIPFAILIAVPVMVFFAWFRRKKQQ